jgi:hypothetical protein
MKRVEGLFALGAATALLASGCGGEKQQTPEVAGSLTKTIKPVVIEMAKKAITLSNGNQAKFSPYYEDGETTLSRTVDGPGDGFRDVVLTFSGDESQVGLKTLKAIEVEDADCEKSKKGKDDFDCPFGETYTLYTPRTQYKGQKTWEASDTGYAQLPGEDYPGGYEIDTVNDFAEGKSAVPTAKDIVREAHQMFNDIVAAPDF